MSAGSLIASVIYIGSIVVYSVGHNNSDEVTNNRPTEVLSECQGTHPTTAAGRCRANADAL
jgi:hypothetical protein